MSEQQFIEIEMQKRKVIAFLKKNWTWKVSIFIIMFFAFVRKGIFYVVFRQGEEGRNLQ